MNQEGLAQTTHGETAMRTAILFILIATSAYAADISAGLMNYKPSMTAVRAQHEYDRDLAGWYVRLRAETNKGTNILTYTNSRLTGDRTIAIHSIESTVVAEPNTKIAPYLGFGPGLIYMRRQFRDDVVFNTYLWSANAMIGVRLRTSVGLDAGYQYTWRKVSTLGGTEYDLSDGRWYVGMTVGN